MPRLAQALRIVRRGRQRAVIGGERILFATQRAQRIAAVVERERMARRDRERGVVVDERLLGHWSISARALPRLMQGLDMARLFREHRVEGGDRFRRPFEIEQYAAAVVERVEMAGRERQRLVELRQRLVAALERVQHQRQVRQRVGRARLDLQRSGDEAIGLARPCHAGD